MTTYDPEGFDPQEEGFDLPYPYTENYRAGSISNTLAIAALTPLMGAITYFGLFTLPLWLILLPIVLVVVRQSVYQLLVNAIHEAVRCAHADAVLDEELATQALEAEEDEHALNAERFQHRIAERSGPLSDETAY